MTKRVLAVVVASVALVMACSGSGQLDVGAPDDLPFDDIDVESSETTHDVDEVEPSDGPAADISSEPDGAIELGDGVSLQANPDRIEPGFDDLSDRFAGIDTFGDDPALDALWSQCEGGDLSGCDELFLVSPIGSAYETFGDTCGGRMSSAAGTCADPAFETVVEGQLGDHPGLDALWAACAVGSYDACDDLWGMSAGGSGYEAYGSTCGDTTAPTQGGCVEHFGVGAGDDLFADEYGDDPGLDAVHDACATEGAAACNLLFEMSPLDSGYERFAATCGQRRALTFTQCV